ncbi:dienelactone hydrolase [Catenulispora sp. EB89]|uniref:dienelactone hydrolase family protein n=1 Tax=Catenulispora sp. EB89 TaxID=3156257 RepID=UPI003516DDB5
MSGVSWRDSRQIGPRITQRSFTIDRPPEEIPGTVWTPTRRSGTPPPLVLLGHGGSGHRLSDRIVAMAARFAAAGYAAAAIDGPFHGERVRAPLTPAEYQARVAAEGIGAVLDRIAADWVATTAHLAEAGIADGTRVAYVGLSMGTRFGLPAAAALGPSLRCAVFGKFGLTSSAAFNPALHVPDRVRRDAAHITAPVFFHMQWDDELFPRSGQLDLFDAFAGADKELHAFAGRHSHTPQHAPGLWRSFVERHLAPA